MERLLYEFPHGRPAYSPLVNEIEFAPHTELWQNNNKTEALYGGDIEYAVSRKFILEAGISKLTNESQLPAFIHESGLELGAYYTYLNNSHYVITFGLESQFQLDKENNDNNKASLEPMILAAVALDKFQIHAGISAEISSLVKPGFFIAGIYHLGFIRPFIEVDNPNEKTNTFMITPGLVIPFYEDFHCGIGFPFANSKAGLTLFVAIELGDEE